MTNIPDLQQIRRHLKTSLTPGSHAQHENLAAIGAVFSMAYNHQPSLLLIERASRQGDPWSGQIALPGGKKNSRDAHVLETVIRETKEEVGITLHSHEFVGWRPAVRARRHGMKIDLWVHTAVFVLEHAPAIVLSDEVASCRWIPFRDLLDPAYGQLHEFQYFQSRYQLPSMQLGGYLLWGLTHGILTDLFKTLGCELPPKYQHPFPYKDLLDEGSPSMHADP